MPIPARFAPSSSEAELAGSWSTSRANNQHSECVLLFLSSVRAVMAQAERCQVSSWEE